MPAQRPLPSMQSAAITTVHRLVLLAGAGCVDALRRLTAVDGPVTSRPAALPATSDSSPDLLLRSTPGCGS